MQAGLEKMRCIKGLVVLKITFFCVWEATRACARTQHPPPVPKCKANCKAICDAKCEAGCDAKWEECGWMKYPHRPISHTQDQQPNPTQNVTFAKKLKKFCHILKTWQCRGVHWNHQQRNGENANVRLHLLERAHYQPARRDLSLGILERRRTLQGTSHRMSTQNQTGTGRIARPITSTKRG